MTTNTLTPSILATYFTADTRSAPLWLLGRDARLNDAKSTSIRRRG